MSILSALADDLRARHFSDRPLILANVWDAASARAVAGAGHKVLATSSAAVGASLGVGDHEQMTADAAFAAVRRVTNAVEIPVTADLEAGYGLPAGELVERLLDAGAVGCNLEDSDHHGAAPLRDADRQAEYIAAVCEAAKRAGVNVVVNARIDIYLHQAITAEDPVAEALRRGQKYLEAGATCVFPIGVKDQSDISALVSQLGGPVNVFLRPDGPTLADLRGLGVARVSLAALLQHQAMTQVASLATSLLGQDRAFEKLGDPFVREL
jgi:2-methylisocitrate lyase-like PEP mutase family enzyme